MPDCVAVAIHTPAGVVAAHRRLQDRPDAARRRGDGPASLCRSSGLEGVLVAARRQHEHRAARASAARSATSSTASRRSSPARAGASSSPLFSSSIYRMQMLVDLADQFERQGGVRRPRHDGELADRAAARVPASAAGGADPGQRRPGAIPRRTSSASAPARRASRRRRSPASPSTTTATSKLDPDDVVVFSAREIPGNEKAIGRVMNHIARRGADIVHEGIKHVHVSGHGSEEELKLDALPGQAALLRADTRGVPPARPARAGGARRSSPGDEGRCSPRTATSSGSTRTGARIAEKAAGRPDPDRRDAQRRGGRRSAARPPAPGGRRPRRAGASRSAGSPGRSRRRPTSSRAGSCSTRGPRRC